ncbi:MAG: protein kinase [Nanoarchaeota archaeon]
MRLLENMTIQECVASILDRSKYSGLTPIDEKDQGMQRQTFTVEFGLSQNKTKRIVKADKAPEGSNSTFVVSRGCGTRRELDLLGRLSVEDAISNNVSPLLDAYIEDDFAVSVEPLFDKCTTLKKFVAEKGKLNYSQTKQIFNQVLKGATFLRKNNLYHRDLSPSNILVRKTKESFKDDLEARITDLSNAQLVNQVEQSLAPTAGGRLIRDPLLGAQFTGKEETYSDQTEIYALGITMCYALTGETPFEYDFLTGEAKHKDSKVGDLLDENKKLILENHNAVVKNALSKLKGRSKRFKPLLERALTADETKRFESLEDFVSEYNNVTSKVFTDQFIDNPDSLMIWGVSAGIAILGVMAAYSGSEQQDIQRRIDVAKASQYQVYAEFDGADMEIRNNAIKLEVMAYNSSNDLMPRPIFPEEVTFIRAQPGEKICISTSLKAAPLPEEIAHEIEMSSFHGRAYIEGLPLDDKTSCQLSAMAYPNDNSKMMGQFQGRRNYNSSGYITIPENQPSGVYPIAVEMDSPENEKLPGPIISGAQGGIYESVREEQIPKSKINYIKPRGILARKRINVVVGNPSTIIDQSYVRRDFGAQSSLAIGIEDIENREHIPFEKYSINYPLLPIKCITNIVPNQWVEDSNIVRYDRAFFNNLPRSTNIEKRNVHVIFQDTNGKTLYSSVVPMESYNFMEGVKDYDGNKMAPDYQWRFRTPDRNFGKEIACEREELEKIINSK